MRTRPYTDDELAALRAMPKRVTNSNARWSNKPKARPTQRQRIFQVSGVEDENAHFLIYQRQSLDDEHNFSCGISYLPSGSPSLTLARYNGPGHEHGDIVYRTHIHRASERAIAAGLKPESEAKETDRFSTLEGALACLIDDFNLRGRDAPGDQLEMFS